MCLYANRARRGPVITGLGIYGYCIPREGNRGDLRSAHQIQSVWGLWALNLSADLELRQMSLVATGGTASDIKARKYHRAEQCRLHCKDLVWDIYKAKGEQCAIMHILKYAHFLTDDSSICDYLREKYYSSMLSLGNRLNSKERQRRRLIKDTYYLMNSL